MTRRSRRELEWAVEELTGAHDVDGAPRRPSQTVYRDPVSGRCFEGWGPDAAPVETLPEDVDLLVIRRAVSMMRAEAEADGREIIEVVDAHGGGEIVAVRIEPAPDVDAEAAVTLPEERLGPTIGFAGVDT